MLLGEVGKALSAQPGSEKPKLRGSEYLRNLRAQALAASKFEKRHTQLGSLAAVNALRPSSHAVKLESSFLLLTVWNAQNSSDHGTSIRVHPKEGNNFNTFVGKCFNVSGSGAASKCLFTPQGNALATFQDILDYVKDCQSTATSDFRHLKPKHQAMMKRYERAFDVICLEKGQQFTTEHVPDILKTKLSVEKSLTSMLECGEIGRKAPREHVQHFPHGSQNAHQSERGESRMSSGGSSHGGSSLHTLQSSKQSNHAGGSGTSGNNNALTNAPPEILLPPASVSLASHNHTRVFTKNAPIDEQLTYDSMRNSSGVAQVQAQLKAVMMSRTPTSRNLKAKTTHSLESFEDEAPIDPHTIRLMTSEKGISNRRVLHHLADHTMRSSIDNVQNPSGNNVSLLPRECNAAQAEVKISRNLGVISSKRGDVDPITASDLSSETVPLHTRLGIVNAERPISQASLKRHVVAINTQSYREGSYSQLAASKTRDDTSSNFVGTVGVLKKRRAQILKNSYLQEQEKDELSQSSYGRPASVMSLSQVELLPSSTSKKASTRRALKSIDGESDSEASEIVTFAKSGKASSKRRSLAGMNASVNSEISIGVDSALSSSFGGSKAFRGAHAKLDISFPLGIVYNRFGEPVRTDGGELHRGAIVFHATSGDLFKLEWLNTAVGTAHCRRVMRPQDPALRHFVHTSDDVSMHGLHNVDLGKERFVGRDMIHEAINAPQYSDKHRHSRASPSMSPARPMSRLTNPEDDAPYVVVPPSVSFLTDDCTNFPMGMLRPTTTFTFLLWINLPEVLQLADGIQQVESDNESSNESDGSTGDDEESSDDSDSGASAETEEGGNALNASRRTRMVVTPEARERIDALMKRNSSLHKIGKLRAQKDSTRNLTRHHSSSGANGGYRSSVLHPKSFGLVEPCYAHEHSLARALDGTDFQTDETYEALSCFCCGEAPCEAKAIPVRRSGSMCSAHTHNDEEDADRSILLDNDGDDIPLPTVPSQEVVEQEEQVRQHSPEVLSPSSMAMQVASKDPVIIVM